MFIKNKIYRDVILPVVLYGCKTWSLTLREELDNYGAEEDILAEQELDNTAVEKTT
jgi:hypothetical protein